MADVLQFTGISRLDMEPDRILQGAIDAGLTEVIVCGFDKDGELYAAASMASGPDALWLAELFKRQLLELGAPKDPS